MSLVKDGTSILHSHTQSLYQSGTISLQEKQHLEFKIQTLQKQITGYYEHYGGQGQGRVRGQGPSPPQANPNRDPNSFEDRTTPNKANPNNEVSKEEISEMSDEEIVEETDIMAEHEDNGTLTRNQEKYLSALRAEVLNRLGNKETESKSE